MPHRAENAAAACGIHLSGITRVAAAPRGQLTLGEMEFASRPCHDPIGIEGAVLAVAIQAAPVMA